MKKQGDYSPPISPSQDACGEMNGEENREINS